MITVRYSSIDHYRETRRFKTIEAACRYAIMRVGVPEFGSGYAVSADGVGKIEVEGCTLVELFTDIAKGGAYEVHVGFFHEERGLHFYLDSSYATLAEANARAQQLDEEGVDDLRLVGTTDEAKAEIEAQRQRHVMLFGTIDDNPF